MIKIRLPQDFYWKFLSACLFTNIKTHTFTDGKWETCIFVLLFTDVNYD